MPLLRVARRGLAAEYPPAIFGPPALARLERQLLRTLARTAELALFDELKAFRAADRGGYDAFVRSQLEAGLVPLFCDYPVLARQVAVLIGRWVAATAELASRIVIDREALATTFADGTDTGLVVDIEPALSDAHHGGRRVAALTFASGLRVVYKPRSLALDAAYGTFLAWVAAQPVPAGRAPTSPAPTSPEGSPRSPCGCSIAASTGGSSSSSRKPAPAWPTCTATSRSPAAWSA